MVALLTSFFLVYFLIGLIIAFRVSFLLLFAGELKSESVTAIVLGGLITAITWPRLFFVKE